MFTDGVLYYLRTNRESSCKAVTDRHINWKLKFSLRCWTSLSKSFEYYCVSSFIYWVVSVKLNALKAHAGPPRENTYISFTHYATTLMYCWSIPDRGCRSFKDFKISSWRASISITIEFYGWSDKLKSFYRVSPNFKCITWTVYHTCVYGHFLIVTRSLYYDIKVKNTVTWHFSVKRSS